MQPSRKESVRRSTALFANLITAAAAGLACLLVLEVAVRARQRLRYGVERHHSRSNFAEDPETGLMVPIPGGKVGAIEINSLGFRGPEIVVPKPRNTLRVAFLGASTTFCTEIRDESSTWPYLVAERLRQRFPGVRFDYLNAAVPGYTTEQTIVRLDAQVSQLAPDLIVIYHANNDLVRETTRLAGESGIPHHKNEDWLGQYSLAWDLLRKNLLIRQRTRSARQGSDRLSLDTAAFAQGFQTRLEKLVRRSLEETDLVVLPTFAYKVRRDQSDEEKLKNSEVAIFYMPYLTPESLLRGYERYNQVIRKVADRSGAILVETALEVPADEEHFSDTFHLRPAGAFILAEVISDSLVRDVRLQRVVEEIRSAP